MKVIQTQGKRKQAMARASLREGKGNVKINGQYLDNYSTEISRLRVKEPLVLVGDVAQKVNIDVTVVGGGENGQADAARLAIARALVAYNKDFKKIFDEYDRLLLVADVRLKEVCKPNDSKARAKRQKSYR
ncbi:30S ribosomal protein S9 [Candidatus Woesearchaeota archaeon CG10_big_fil_rev_8_21_14_0_10_32_24]|nr:MAG: 30S ribosomal protein S9 [Candidatus Woesearchaeota archaeon CG10_big_fil_rev_8_21_14_0_10_32_24]